MRNIAFEGCTSYGHEELPSNASVRTIQAVLHRLVDGSHHHVGKENPAHHGKRNENHDDEALHVLSHHRLPVLLLLVTRPDNGDYGEDDKQYHPDDRDDEKSPFDVLRTHEARQQIRLLPAYRHRLDSAQLVEDCLDEIDDEADASEEPIEQAEEEISQCPH